MTADILLYGLVAAGLVFWLRNILGTRHGDENERPNPFAGLPEKPNADPARNAEKSSFLGDAPESGAPVLDRNVSLESAAVENGIADIARADKGFELPTFIKGAQDAFVIVVEAFADKDKETLENLLAEPLYESFSAVIDEREKKGEQASVEIHAVRKVDVLEAGLNGKNAFVTVRFIADETSILRDKDDKLIFGDPERVTETRDIWTFSRNVSSRDPRWLLVATREDEDDEISGSTVPETEDQAKDEAKK